MSKIAQLPVFTVRPTEDEWLMWLSLPSSCSLRLRTTDRMWACSSGSPDLVGYGNTTVHGRTAGEAIRNMRALMMSRLARRESEEG